MAFESINEFLNMGGYGFYVWLSYGFTAIVLLLLTINSSGKDKRIFKQINKRLKREEKLKQVAKRNVSKQHNAQSDQKVV